MYLYEVSWRYLERFLSYRADTTISQKLLFSISKGHNSKNTQPRVTALALCTSSHVALYLCKVSWKYLKRFLSYRADTILWQTDGWTDGQTARAKTKCLPTLRGRHNYRLTKCEHGISKTKIISLFDQQAADKHSLFEIGHEGVCVMWSALWIRFPLSISEEPDHALSIYFLRIS